MTKEDEELLDRVAKEIPEGLNDEPADKLHNLIERLVHGQPAPKEKRKNRTTSRKRPTSVRAKKER